MREKAVEEDPTVFQYDEIYDDMDKKRKESKLARKDIDKKPKYISRLLAAADKRKKENERRIERQVQKEREAEGEEFKDKDSFVTSAYRKKLEEMKALEEEEKREEYLESIGDVKKQGNLDGFYRHLYDQKVNYETTPVDLTKDTETNKRKHEDESPKNSNKNVVKERKYRKRDNSLSDEEKPLDETVKKEHLPSNLDADSDFSIDSESETENDTTKDSATVTNAEPPVEDKVIKEEEPEKDEPIKENIAEEIKTETKQNKPKIDIWKKRTVGEVFIAALQRYFERKASRESG